MLRNEASFELLALSKEFYYPVCLAQYKRFLRNDKGNHKKSFSHLLRKNNSFFILLFKIYPYNCNTDYAAGIRKRIQSTHHIARRQ